MANEMIAGAEALVERILQDARHDAAATLKEAEANAEDVQANAARESERAAAAAKKQREDAVNAILDRSRTNAELTARKQALEKRRKVLDHVFDEAYERLCKLDDAQRAKVCAGLLYREAEGGETILPAQSDRALIENMLSDVNARLATEGKTAVALSKENAQFDHGFVLVGGGFEKDCSFLAVLRDVRADEDANVSAILFN